MLRRTRRMRVVGLALAAVLAVSAPESGRAAGPGSNVRPAPAEPLPNVVLVWDVADRAGARGRPSASRERAPSNGTDRRALLIGDQPPTAGHQCRLIGSGFQGVQSLI